MHAARLLAKYAARAPVAARSFASFSTRQCNSSWSWELGAAAGGASLLAGAVASLTWQGEEVHADASAHTSFQHPLTARYASKEMSYIWSPQNKFSTWRRMWVALAQGEQELGLPITDAQLAEMREHLDDIDFDLAKKKERELRHDVMAHIHTFGTACPLAMPVIHLGATSCFVTWGVGADTVPDLFIDALAQQLDSTGSAASAKHLASLFLFPDALRVFPSRFTERLGFVLCTCAL